MKKPSTFWELVPLEGEFRIETPEGKRIGSIRPDGESFYVQFKERADLHFVDSDLMVCVGYVRGIEKAMSLGIIKKSKRKRES